MTIQEIAKTEEPAIEMITLTIDGFEVSVPKGTLVIRAAEKLGIQIPRFCDHPLLDPVGACRQCLVEIEINGRKFPKPQASCTIPVEPGMVVNTQLTSAVAQKERPMMLSQRSSNLARSASVPTPFSRSRKICTNHQVPSRQGVHLPHDSCL